jgi:hypothetical protein
VPEVLRKLIVNQGQKKMWGGEGVTEAYGRGNMPSFQYNFITNESIIPNVAKIMKDPSIPAEHKEQIRSALLGIAKQV